MKSAEKRVNTARGYSKSAGPIHHFKLYSEGHHVRAGEVYAAGRGPQGRIRHLPALQMQDPGALIRSSSGDGLLKPRHMLADVSAILGSLNIVFGEIDR